MGYSNLVQDVADTQSQLGESDTTIPVFALFRENIVFEDLLVTINSQNIGHAFIVGHAANGIVGAALGTDGQQIIIGAGGLGASAVAQVHCPNKKFKEFLVTNEVVDTTTTTATVNTTTQAITF